MIIPNDLKPRIVAELLKKRAMFDGTDGQFARSYGINASVYSVISNGGDLTGKLRDAQWLNIARELNMSLTERKWNTAQTDVFLMIQEDVEFCKTYSKSLMLCDDCGIGKTHTAMYLSNNMKNVFYVDASQCNTKNEFTKALAKVIGVDETGKLATVRKNIKYALRMLPYPCVIVDEAGALEEKAAMMLIEMWNATQNACGWYLMGADGLRAKIERNIGNNKVGWAELFSRFNERYSSIVPAEKQEKIQFYKKLISDVLSVNVTDKKQINEIVKKCLQNDSGRISGLRRAETLVLLHSEVNK